MKFKPEILAPVGSFEKAKTAIRYGADAIYCGTSSLSLRTRTNMSDEELVKTINYAHSKGKKVYVNINIYAWDEKYQEIKEQAKLLNDLKVDGIIVADGGVVDVLKEYAPDVDIHISTQANTVSYHSANFWYKNGAKRVILARELNKEQIRELMEHKPKDLEVEIFVHGAICFGYSGRCFLSDFLTGRSANLGDCAQCCRWGYNIYLEDKNNEGTLLKLEDDDKGTYIMSSKDLCLIKEIPEIVDMGIDSLKIEGRLKTEYYLATVINAYRCAIDDYMSNPNEYDFNKYLTELNKVKTRGLTTFYFNDRNNKDFQEYKGRQYNENFEYAGKVIKVLDKQYSDSSVECKEGNTVGADYDKSVEVNLESGSGNCSENCSENGKNNVHGYEVVLEIKNKLSVGDKIEIIIPNSIDTVDFVIDKLWDIDTNEEIEAINPGRAEQKVKMVIPIKVEEGYILRRVK